MLKKSKGIIIGIAVGGLLVFTWDITSYWIGANVLPIIFAILVVFTLGVFMVIAWSHLTNKLDELSSKFKTGISNLISGTTNEDDLAIIEDLKPLMTLFTLRSFALLSITMMASILGAMLLIQQNKYINTQNSLIEGQTSVIKQQEDLAYKPEIISLKNEVYSEIKEIQNKLYDAGYLSIDHFLADVKSNDKDKSLLSLFTTPSVEQNQYFFRDSTYYPKISSLTLSRMRSLLLNLTPNKNRTAAKYSKEKGDLLTYFIDADIIFDTSTSNLDFTKSHVSNFTFRKKKEFVIWDMEFSNSIFVIFDIQNFLFAQNNLANCIFDEMTISESNFHSNNFFNSTFYKLKFNSALSGHNSFVGCKIKHLMYDDMRHLDDIFRDAIIDTLTIHNSAIPYLEDKELEKIKHFNFTNAYHGDSKYLKRLTKYVGPIRLLAVDSVTLDRKRVPFDGSAYYKSKPFEVLTSISNMDYYKSTSMGKEIYHLSVK